LRRRLGYHRQVFLLATACIAALTLYFGILFTDLTGMLVGQIRSLRNFGVIGSASVYINLLIIFMSMGVVAHTLPNYAVANAADSTLGDGPVIVQAFNSQDLIGQVNGMFK
jgi:uncharacterized membrane protein